MLQPLSYNQTNNQNNHANIQQDITTIRQDNNTQEQKPKEFDKNISNFIDSKGSSEKEKQYIKQQISAKQVGMFSKIFTIIINKNKQALQDFEQKFNNQLNVGATVKLIDQNQQQKLTVNLKTASLTNQAFNIKRPNSKRQSYQPIQLPQIKIQKLKNKLDKNNPNDRALELALRMSQQRKARQLAYLKKDSKKLDIKGLQFNDPRYKSLQIPSNIAQNLSPIKNRTLNVGKIIKLSNINSSRINNFQEQIKPRLYQNSPKQNFLPPLPESKQFNKQKLSIQKEQSKKQKLRQIQILEYSKRLNQVYHLKKYITNLIFNLCDQAVDRIEQKRTFFSYKIHRARKLSKNKQSNENQEKKLSQSIRPKHERAIQNANNLHQSLHWILKLKKREVQQQRDEQSKKNVHDSRRYTYSRNRSRIQSVFSVTLGEKQEKDQSKQKSSKSDQQQKTQNQNSQQRQNSGTENQNESEDQKQDQSQSEQQNQSVQQSQASLENKNTSENQSNKSKQENKSSDDVNDSQEDKDQCIIQNQKQSDQNQQNRKYNINNEQKKQQSVNINKQQQTKQINKSKKQQKIFNNKQQQLKNQTKTTKQVLLNRNRNLKNPGIQVMKKK